MKKIISITVIAILLLALLYLWLVGRDFIYGFPIDDNAFSSFGDFVGGLFGTLFAALAVYYAWLTFKKETIKNRFYEMLKQHNENVKRLEIQGVDVFEKYIEVLKSINTCVLKELTEQDDDSIDKKDEGSIDKAYFKLSYLYFFYGTPLDPKTYSSQINIEEEKIKRMNEHFAINNIEIKGYSLDLGIYFRQLYQIATYVNDDNTLNYKEKYNYIKSLRVCLNLSEQYLFFLNSISSLGEIWELLQNGNNHNKRLITKYNLLKNLPKSYNDKFEKFNFEKIYPDIYYEYMPHEKKQDREKWEKKYS
jgi:hypothetical protein